MAWFDNYCRKYIAEGLSLMAVDTDTQELVGLAITTVCKREWEGNIHKYTNDWILG